MSSFVSDGLTGVESGSHDSADHTFESLLAEQVANQPEAASSDTPVRTSEDEVRGELDVDRLMQAFSEPDLATDGLPFTVTHRGPKPPPEPRVVQEGELVVPPAERSQIERELEEGARARLEVARRNVADAEEPEAALESIVQLRAQLSAEDFAHELHSMAAGAVEWLTGEPATGEQIAATVQELQSQLGAHDAVQSFRRAEAQAAEARRLADEARPGQIQAELKSWATERGYDAQTANHRLRLLSEAFPGLETIEIEQLPAALRALDDAAMEVAGISPQQTKQRELEAIYDSVLNTDLGTVDDGLQVLTSDGRLLNPVREHARAVARQAAAEQAAKMPRAPQPRRRHVETADEIRAGVGLAAIDDETFLSDGLRYSDGTPVSAADLEALTTHITPQKTKPLAPGQIVTIGGGGLSGR
jgi:hypothetical protein